MAEGYVECSLKYRDHGKWKLRWGILKKLSPVADCAHLYLRKDSDAFSFRKSFVSGSYDEKLLYSDTKLVLLEEFIGNVSDFELDFEKHVLSVVCRRRVVTLAFYNCETLNCWSTFINKILGEGAHYSVKLVKAPSELHWKSGLLHLFIRSCELCLTTKGVMGFPPAFLASWPISHLCRFGVQQGCLCFVAGEQTDFPGVFALQTSSSAQINYLLNKLVKHSLTGIKLAPFDCSSDYGLCDLPCSAVRCDSSTNCRNVSNPASYEISSCYGASHSSCSSRPSQTQCCMVSNSHQLVVNSVQSPYRAAQESCVTTDCYQHSNSHANTVLSSQHTDTCPPAVASNCTNDDESRRETNWRRHSFSDIYRKMYNAVDGFVSHSWLSRSLSKFVRQTSNPSEEHGQCSAVNDGIHICSNDCHQCGSLAINLNRANLSSAKTHLAHSSFDNSHTASTLSHASDAIKHGRPPPVPPRKLAKQNRDVGRHPKILIQKQSCSPVRHQQDFFESGPCQTLWGSHNSSEPTWRHTVMSCSAEEESDGSVLCACNQQSANEKLTPPRRDLKFARSHSVGNELNSAGRFSVHEMNHETTFCKSSNILQEESHSSASLCARQRPEGRSVKSGKYRESSNRLHGFHQSSPSCDDRLSSSVCSRTGSTSSLDLLGVPPPVPIVSHCAASSPQKIIPAAYSHSFNSQRYAATEVRYDIESAVSTTTQLLSPSMSRLQDRRRMPRKPHLTVTTGSAPASFDSNKHCAGFANAHASALPRLLSDLKPHSVQSQPATPAVLGSRSPHQPPKSGLQRSTSQAATTLRPRNGKEYYRINRRRLASASAAEWSPPVATPRSPGSQSLATLCVFDFDTLTCAQDTSRYRNLSECNGIDLDSVLIPQNPVSKFAVNYTDLDLSDSSECKTRTECEQPSSTLYADIDFEATSAVSRAGREHDLDRRDNRLSALSRTSTQRQVHQPSGLQA